MKKFFLPDFFVPVFVAAIAVPSAFGGLLYFLFATQHISIIHYFIHLFFFTYYFMLNAYGVLKSFTIYFPGISFRATNIEPLRGSEKFSSSMNYYLLNILCYLVSNFSELMVM